MWSLIWYCDLYWEIVTIGEVFASTPCKIMLNIRRAEREVYAREWIRGWMKMSRVAFIEETTLTGWNERFYGVAFIVVQCISPQWMASVEVSKQQKLRRKLVDQIQQLIVLDRSVRWEIQRTDCISAIQLTSDNNSLKRSCEGEACMSYVIPH